MSKPPLERVTVTIAKPLLEAADRLAAKLQRSRSWVLSEGLRLLTGQNDPAVTELAQVSPYTAQAVELEEVAARRLEADLQLAPERRLLLAEELVRLGRVRHPARWRRQIVAFDSYEEYSEWKTNSRAGG